MALLNNPEACAKISALYSQIQDVYEEERLRYQNLCCDLCGAHKCVREVMGFPFDLAPKLCIYHGAAWNSAFVRLRNTYTTEYFFAKWLAKQVLKEARKIKRETHDQDATRPPRFEAVERTPCAKENQPF